MVEYRNQHYVPEFYLRGFANEDKRIQLYNTEARMEFNESISDVCSRDYFYSKDKNVEVETTLSEIEGKLADGLGSIVNAEAGRDSPQVSGEQWFLVMSFLTLQDTRTARSQREIKGDSDFLFEKFVEWGVENGELSEDVLERLKSDEVRLEWDQTPQLGLMLHQLHTGVLLSDLEGIVLVNDTDSDLITSDHPVVRHNPYFAGGEYPQVVGYQSRGLQIHCPLTPDLYLLLLDLECYEFEERNAGSVTIESDETIRELNRLQMVNCEDNAFYKNSGMEVELQTLHEELASKMAVDRVSRGEYKASESEGVFTHIDVPSYQPELSFVSEKPDIEFDVERSPGLTETNEQAIEDVYGDLI